MGAAKLASTDTEHGLHDSEQKGAAEDSPLLSSAISGDTHGNEQPVQSASSRCRKKWCCVVGVVLLPVLVVPFLPATLEANSHPASMSHMMHWTLSSLESSRKPMLSFVTPMQHRIGRAVGCDSDLHDFEQQALCRLETIANSIGRRLILLPPSQMLHKYKNASHGWSFLYDQPFDDSAVSSLDSLFRAEPNMSKDEISVDADNVVDRLKHSSADLLILQQWGAHNRPCFDGDVLQKIAHALSEETTARCPPAPSRFIVGMGDKVRTSVGEYVTVDVRRENPTSFSSSSNDDIVKATSAEHIVQVLRQGGVTRHDTVLLFTNMLDSSIFDAVADAYPKTLFEDDIVRIVASYDDRYHYNIVMQRSPLRSAVFRRQLARYLAGFGTKTICTVESKMYIPCDAYLVK